jgi:hypothetical protein
VKSIPTFILIKLGTINKTSEQSDHSGFGLQIISPIWQSCFSVEADSDVLSFSSEVKVMYQAMPRT